jgi:hypothetical protein
LWAPACGSQILIRISYTCPPKKHVTHGQNMVFGHPSPIGSLLLWVYKSLVYYNGLMTMTIPRYGCTIQLLSATRTVVTGDLIWLVHLQPAQWGVQIKNDGVVVRFIFHGITTYRWPTPIMIIMLWFIEGPVSTKDQKKARGITELRGWLNPPWKFRVRTIQYTLRYPPVNGYKRLRVKSPCY